MSSFPTLRNICYVTDVIIKLFLIIVNSFKKNKNKY